MPSSTLAIRFWSKIDIGQPDECWRWKAATRKKGYGIFEKNTAHRVMWALTIGPIPAGLWVLHTCDNPPCVNPAHLFLGTNADNVADSCRKGRRHHPPAKSVCVHGHPKTPETTYHYIDPRGHLQRRCRMCHVIESQRDRARVKARL